MEQFSKAETLCIEQRWLPISSNIPRYQVLTFHPRLVVTTNNISTAICLRFVLTESSFLKKSPLFGKIVLSLTVFDLRLDVNMTYELTFTYNYTNFFDQFSFFTVSLTRYIASFLSNQFIILPFVNCRLPTQHMASYNTSTPTQPKRWVLHKLSITPRHILE